MSRLRAAMYDWSMSRADAKGLGKWRRALLADLHGEVAEIGVGTGLNLLHYPATVDRLVLTDPDASCLRRARRRLEIPEHAQVELLHGTAEAIPLPDSSVDAVVSTLVLCSVPDVAASMAEVRRVLRPGGRFVFLEHVAAHDDDATLRWQRRIEPFWKLISHGCHLTRRTAEAIEAAGFEFERLQREPMRKAPRAVRPCVRGVARAPG